MAMLGSLRELYDVADLKLNLKFEVEVLCKALGIDLKDIRPAEALHARKRPDLSGNPDFNPKAATNPESIPGIPPREGGAAAITAARNAENLKNVAATDSFGNLPNMNAGEVAIRLPSIYGELDAGGNLAPVLVRNHERQPLQRPRALIGLAMDAIGYAHFANATVGAGEALRHLVRLYARQAGHELAPVRTHGAG